MAQSSSPENLSDDEIFFGKLTLKEVKKRLNLPYNHRQTIMCATETVRVSNDESISIIETHSEPDMRSVRDPVTSLDCSNASFASSVSMGLDLTSAGDSFLRNEAMVNELCNSEAMVNELCNSEAMVNESCISSVKKHNDKGTSTPLTEIKQTKEIFKTPKEFIPKKNQTLSLNKTPGKTNAFQHIASPVASYIKNSPQVPLLRNVRPTKPLPGTSFIPKAIKNTNIDKGKENVLLPSIAYRNAKTTKMVTIPDKEKLPKSPWAKKIASSQPKPVVIKHCHREGTSVKKPVFTHQESFGDLPLHEADVSICTEKSALSK